MDTNKMKPITDAANIEATGWKSTENRKKTVKKIAGFLIQHGPPSWAQDSSGLMKSIEIFEEKVFASARDEVAYIANISAKVKKIRPLQSGESNLLLSKSYGSGAERESYRDQERLYQKVQTLRNTYFTKLDFLYKQISRKLQEHESVPQQPKTTDMERCKHHKQVLEYIFAVFKVNKSQITPNFKQRLDKVEKYIHGIQSIVLPKNVSLRRQEQHSADGHSMQQFGPSHSRNSQLEISGKKPTSQLMSRQSSHSTKQTTQPNKMHLPDHQVANRFGSSQQQANEMSIKKGCGNVVQQQTSGEIKSSEAFAISNPGISASPMLEDCSNVKGISPNPTAISTPGISASPMLEDCINVKGISPNPTAISDETSAAMQRLIKVLSSISTEALITSCDKIGEVVHSNDYISTIEPLNGPPNSEIDTNLEGVDDPDPQTRYLTCNDFVQGGRKMSRFINSMPTSGSFLQVTGAENPYSNSVTSQGNYTLLEEIKKINNRLIDTEIVIGEEKTIPSAIEGVTEHGEGGLIVELTFNSVTVDVNLMSQYTSNKKSIIKPLHLLVPSSYPLCSPVIFDEMPLQISKDLEDLSMKAKFKLRFSLQSLNQPLSLMDIALIWGHCAREAICEYSKLHGGGTFSSKYGGWEICQDAG